MIYLGFRELLWVLNGDCIGVERSWLHGDHPGIRCDADQAGGSGHAKEKYSWVQGLFWTVVDVGSKGKRGHL